MWLAARELDWRGLPRRPRPRLQKEVKQWLYRNCRIRPPNPQAAIQETISAMAWTRREDGAEAGSWRDEQSWLGPAGWGQGARHRRGSWGGARGCECPCARRPRSRAPLFSAPRG